MKKIFLLTMVFILLMTQAVFAANFAIDDNPDYVAPVTNRAYYNKGETVTFNDKSTSCFYDYAPKWFPNSVFSWSTGASGNSDDYAPYVKVATDDATNSSSDQLYLLYQGPNYRLLDGGGVIHIEYDVKLDTTCDELYFADIPLWNSGGGRDTWILFNSDGKIKGTSYSYEANKWIHMNMSYDVEKSSWNVWADGEQIVTNSKDKGNFFANCTRVQLFLRQVNAKNAGEERAGFSIDNFRIYAVSTSITDYIGAKAYNSENEEVSLDEVPCSGAYFNMIFAGDVDPYYLNSEHIVLATSEGAPIPYEFTAEGVNYKLTPKERLLSNTEYKIKISDEIRQYISDYRPPCKILSFKTEDTSTLGIEMVTIQGKNSKSDIEAGDTLNINVEVKNKKEVATTAYSIVCIYNEENGLEAIDNNEVRIDALTGNLPLFITAPNDFDSEKYSIVIYLMDSATGLIIMDSYSFN